MSTREPKFYDAETISMLKSAFDETCAAVPAEHRPKPCARQSPNAFSELRELENVIASACGPAR